MSKKILVLTGSARPNSVGNAILPYIENAAQKAGAQVQVAHVAELNLPFYDAPMPPSAEGFVPEHEVVKSWSELVKTADSVIWLMPEYNHAVTGIQKNAIDWLHSEWKDKPLAIVAYGAYGGKHTLEVVQNILDVVSPDLRQTVGLTLGQDLGYDGSIEDAQALADRIDPVVASVA